MRFNKKLGIARAVFCALAGLSLVTLAAPLAVAQTQAPVPSAAAPARTIPAPGTEVIDEVGRRVMIPARVLRIVSLAPSLTETVYALEAQDRLVGDTDFCDYPPEAQSKEHVGGPINPNVEVVVSLHPDLVLATRQINRLDSVERLARLGIAVYTTDPRSVEEMIESTRRLGAVLGVRERGETLALELRARLAEIRRRVAAQPPRRIFFVVWPDPLISMGRSTFLADAVRLAGGESVIDTAQDWPRLNLEEVLRQQPEVLVFSSTHFEEVAKTVDDLRERTGWRSLVAMREHRIAVVSDAVNRPSPRLVDAIEQLARQLHPAAFSGKPQKGESKPASTPPSIPLAGPADLKVVPSSVKRPREVTPCAR